MFLASLFALHDVEMVGVLARWMMKMMLEMLRLHRGSLNLIRMIIFAKGK